MNLGAPEMVDYTDFGMVEAGSRNIQGTGKGVRSVGLAYFAEDWRAR